MKKEKTNSFFKIKVGIKSFLFFVILALFLGYFFSTFKTNFATAEKADLSDIYEVWDILDNDFLDVHASERKKEISEKDHIWGMVSGLVASYGDPYTVFLPPMDSKELNEDISGEFGGIGVEIENAGGYLTVVSPLPGTPADKAGLRPKDVIVKIDDEDSINISSYEATKLIRGEPGTKVKLTVAREGLVKFLDIEIERAIIEIPVIKTYKKDGVFVIKLYSFTENSPELFFDAVKEFRDSGYDKLLIDLRGNPGGHLFAAVYIAGLFLPEDAVIVTEDYGDEKDVLKSGQYHDGTASLDIFSDRVKIGVLVDGGSASAAEILAGALHDNDRAVLMGSNTYGKGTVQKLEKIGSEGASLKYTIAKFILPSGDWISQKGIPVDIEIKISEDEIKKAREGGSFSDKIDAQLNRAIKEMQKFKTNKDIIKLIKKKREEKMLQAKEDREKTIKEILERK